MAAPEETSAGSGASLPAPRPVDPVPHAIAPSQRYVLAALAHDAALATPGVLGTDSGPGGLYVTASGDSRLTGVICTAVAGGGYEVGLSLVCGLVDLHHLAADVRARVAAAASGAGLALDRVDVLVSAVAEGVPGQ